MREVEVSTREAINDALTALGQRVQTLADTVGTLGGDVRVMIERGGNRDVAIADLRKDCDEQTRDIKQSVAELVNELDERLPTKKEMAKLRTMIIGKDRVDWLKGRSAYYVVGTISAVTAVWLGRDWIRWALSALSRIIPP